MLKEIIVSNQGRKHPSKMVPARINVLTSDF
jgi:hypothetical protein